MFDPMYGGDPLPKAIPWVIGTAAVYLVVRQTLTTASVRLLSDESTSDQVAGGVHSGESGYPTIAYLYRNRPSIGQRHTTSNVQYGAA
jgi:hypothetical protein